MDLPRLSLFKKASTPGALCGLAFLPDGIALTQATGNELKLCEYRQCNASPAARADTLSSLVKQHNLNGQACSWVLAPQQYKLLLVDAPAVPDAELCDAARWRIKDLIDFPLSDALVDVFRVPDHGAGGQRKTMYVIVARLSELQPTIDLIKASGLKLTTIDIHELALRNITALLPENERGTFLVDLKPEQSDLLIGHHAVVYLTRHIKVDLASLISNSAHQNLSDNAEAKAVLDNLVLEIQRSYDYYHSQLGQPEPTKLHLTPMDKFQDEIVDYLNSQLAADVEKLDINSLVHCQRQLNSLTQMRCLPAIGAVLREEVVA